jgi:hypothetical protein
MLPSVETTRTLFALCSGGHVHQQQGELSDALKYFHEALGSAAVGCKRSRTLQPWHERNHWQCMFAARYAKEMVVAFSDSMRYLRLAGKKRRVGLGLLLRTIKCNGAPVA